MGQEQSIYQDEDNNGMFNNGDRDSSLTRQTRGQSSLLAGGLAFCSGVKQCCDAITDDHFTDDFQGNRQGGRTTAARIKARYPIQRGSIAQGRVSQDMSLQNPDISQPNKKKDSLEISHRKPSDVD